MGTNRLSAKDIKRSWHLIDAKGKILGRLATEVARLLMGKNKASFVPYLDVGDYVVITNAAKIEVSGKKATQKKYVRHSGYPSGLRVETYDKLIETKPEKILRHAIAGMLPKTKIGKTMLKKLFVFKDENHNFQKQLGN
ncbi:50S ribosomal protein L13 [Candidatus Daviesbacteria bacterium]|nr:50S ribosomal protein L13 [Candidatus Daviesbacteria bacterium]